MSPRVFFRRLARVEFDDAANWYESRRRGLGAGFTLAVDETIEKIVGQPDRYSAVYQDAREAIARGFPYCVYYLIDRSCIVILSVFNTARDPATWQSRIEGA